MKVLENFSLLHHNTFAMDVKAKRFVEYQNVCELKEVLGRFGGNENLIRKNFSLAGEAISFLRATLTVLFFTETFPAWK